MAVLALLVATIASFGGVLAGIATFSPKNSAYALLLFYLVPAAMVLGFAGAIALTRGTPNSGTRNARRIVLAFVLSFVLGACLGLMTRL